MKTTMKTTRPLTLLLLLTLTLPAALSAQSQPRPEDVATPEAAVLAGYDAINHEAGENFDWERFRTLYAPGAVMIPQAEQVGGEFRVMSVDEFTSWIDEWTAENMPIGSEADRGFYEEQVHSVKHEYGDVVQIISTYQKRFADSDQVLGRGVNFFTLVNVGDGWRIVSVAWDEENAAGPIPAEYLP